MDFLVCLASMGSSVAMSLPSLRLRVCQYRTRTGRLVSGGHWVYPLRKDGEVVAALCLVQPISTKSSLLLTGKQLANGQVPDTALPDEEPSSKAPDIQVIGSNAAFRRMLNTAETTANR